MLITQIFIKRSSQATSYQKKRIRVYLTIERPKSIIAIPGGCSFKWSRHFSNNCMNTHYSLYFKHGITRQGVDTRKDKEVMRLKNLEHGSKAWTAPKVSFWQSISMIYHQQEFRCNQLRWKGGKNQAIVSNVQARISKKVDSRVPV